MFPLGDVNRDVKSRESVAGQCSVSADGAQGALLVRARSCKKRGCSLSASQLLEAEE